MTRGWLSEALFAETRQRVAAGDRVAVAALSELREMADKALDREPPSVRHNGGSPHFRQDAVYVPGQDGVHNPASNMECGHLADRAGRAAMNLALAWRITGEARYAAKALEIIHAWCIDENTRMFPEGQVQDPFTRGAQHGGDIILFLRFHELFYAMALLRDCCDWDLACHGAALRWVRAMVEPQRRRLFFQGREMTNNWEDARLMYLGFGAAALQDFELLLEVFERWKAIIPLKMTDEGQLPRETMRTRSMTYTLAALHGAILVAELAAGYGYDLYDHQVNGRCLQLAVDYAAQHLLHMEDWPFQQITELKTDELRHGTLSVFELAHGHWGEPRYLQVIDAWGGRPTTDTHATLLHAAPRRP